MSVKIQKVDFCMDLKGSFIPDNPKGTYTMMMGLIQKTLIYMCKSKSIKIAGVNDIDCLKVCRGANYLPTCFEYRVLG